MSCKGICIKHAVAKAFRGSHYSNGQKRCMVCEIYLMWDNPFCPCCGTRLRVKPRAKFYKEKWRAMLVA